MRPRRFYNQDYLMYWNHDETHAGSNNIHNVYDP
jgi:hypothetical protein